MGSITEGAKSFAESIREKIKKDQAKAEEKYKGASLRNANMALAAQFGDDEMAKKIATVSEELGDSPEGQKLVGEFLAKFAEQDMKVKSQEKLIKSFSSQPMGGVSQDATSPTDATSPIGGGEPRPAGGGTFMSSLNVGGMTFKSEDAIRREKEIGAEIEIEKGVELQRRKDAKKIATDTKILKGQIMQSTILWKNMRDFTKDEYGLEPGRAAGFLNKWGKLTGANPHVNVFVGDTAETIVSLAKMAVPGARVGEGLVQHFAKTIMDEFSTDPEVIGQMGASLSNSLIKYAAHHPEEFPEGITKEQVSGFIELGNEVFRQILEEESQEKVMFKVGGVTYKIPKEEVEEFKKAKGIK